MADETWTATVPLWPHPQPGVRVVLDADYVTALLERLAPDDPQAENDESGEHWCWFCEGDEIKGVQNHADGCPWVEARRLLGKPT